LGANLIGCLPSGSQARLEEQRLGHCSEMGVVRGCITDGGGSEQVQLGHQKRFSKYITFELGLEG